MGYASTRIAAGSAPRCAIIRPSEAEELTALTTWPKDGHEKEAGGDKSDYYPIPPFLLETVDRIRDCLDLAYGLFNHVDWEVECIGEVLGRAVKDAGRGYCTALGMSLELSFGLLYAPCATSFGLAISSSPYP